MRSVKKIVAIFIIILTSFVVISNAKSGVVKTTVRVRESNTTSSNIITTAYVGDEVTILDEDDSWYKINYNNQIGYMMKNYVTLSKDSTISNEVQNTVSNYGTVVNTNATNVASSVSYELRTAPSIIYKPFSKLDNLDNLQRLIELGNWVKVSNGTVSGWIEKSKIDVNVSEENENTNTISTSNEVQNEVNIVNDNSINNTVSSNNIVNTNSQNIIDTNNTVSASTTNDSNVGKQGIVTVETARVRQSASKNSEVISTLDQEDKITIEGEEGDFYKFSGSFGTGYVSKSLIKIVDSTISSRSLEEERVENTNFISETVTQSNIGSQIVSFAKTYLGYKYVSGGKTPESGFDCSGFTNYVFSNFGYSIGSTTSVQANVGTEISRENIEPGDLLVFLNESKAAIGHVGIYIGNNEFIHSANPSRGVVTDNLQTSSYYNERFVTARRIAN